MLKGSSGSCITITTEFSPGAGETSTSFSVLLPPSCSFVPALSAVCSLFSGRFYPYHYAPFLSDIKNVSELKLTFELEKPFMPFQQLLAVLPAASMELLPEAYRVTVHISFTSTLLNIFNNEQKCVFSALPAPDGQ